MNMPDVANGVRTELLNLQVVREKKIGFLIPSYQRPYVWSDNDALNLFDDILKSFNAGEEAYFIGSSVTACRDADGRVYELIDGQQRTTTLMLISLAFKNREVDSLLAEVSLLGERPRLDFEIRDSVRDWLGSYAGLEQLTRPSAESIHADDYLRHLDANLGVIIQQIETLRRDQSFDLAGFAEYVYKNVSWVNNIVPEKMDLNRLFSNMNTAGIQLEPVDLLKAKLLRKIRTEKRLYSTIWEASEHMENYFERNLRQLFVADWNSLGEKDIRSYCPNVFHINSAQSENDKEFSRRGSALGELLEAVHAGDRPDKAPMDTSHWEEIQTDFDDETVFCDSIISFELLLVHALRLFFAKEGSRDVEPRIKATSLLACFDELLSRDEADIKRFIEHLWQVRFQFDKWIVKWVEHDDFNKRQLGLTRISRSSSGNNTYLNRTAQELNELIQLQAVRYFTGDRAAHYWLTALLGRLLSQPDIRERNPVLGMLEEIDNWMSITSETQKEASFKLARGVKPDLGDWHAQKTYFEAHKGTGFEHYWFQKLEYLLWKARDKSDDKSNQYSIASKNSVEHVHPQNEEYQHRLPTEVLDDFGNLVLLSPGENSSYSNQSVAKKKADFDSKPRYDSLKLKKIFELCVRHGDQWGKTEVVLHRQEMIELLEQHYQTAGGSDKRCSPELLPS